MVFTLAGFLAVSFTFLSPQAHAQSAGGTNNNQLDANIQSLGIAGYIPLEITDALQDGSVISHNNNLYFITQEPYDKSMVGVYDTAPALAFEPLNTDNQIPMITSGTVEVLVNTSNGEIKKGDPVTSSAIPGQAMKANKSGFLLGVAQADFDGSSGQAGLVPVMLDIKFAFAQDSPDSEKISSRLLTVISASAIAAIDEPTVAFKTVVAAFLLIISLVIAFLTFARVAQKGIEALGRNPLASRMISVGIAMNIAVSVLIIISGVVGAYFVITL